MKYKNIVIHLVIFSSLILNNVHPCTMVMAKNDTIVIAGNNEDYSDPNTYMWFVPSDEERKYGCIYFGYSNLRPQGGINEAGLCFDAFATVHNPVLNTLDLPLLPGSKMDFVMKNCSTVSEVVYTYQRYNMSFMNNFQLMFVDSLGNSVIIEGDELIWKTDSYQVCTNFYQSNPSLGGYPCWRYDKANEIFENKQDSISVSLIRDIMDSTHQEGQYPTLYTNIYNLNKRIIYLYINHEYDEWISIPYYDAERYGSRKYSIPSLYSNLKLILPFNDSHNNTIPTAFTWEGNGKNYQLYYSVNSSFENSEMIEIEVSDLTNQTQASISIFILLILLIILTKNNTIINWKNTFMIISILVMINSCNNNITSHDDSPEITIEGNKITVVVEDLLPKTKYFWKVKALNRGPFRSTSSIYNFATSD